MTTTPLDLSTGSPNGAVAGEDVATQADIRGRSPGQIAWSRLRRDRVGMVSLWILAVYVFLAITGQWILDLLGKSATLQDSDLLDQNGLPVGRLGGISSQHWFGVEPLLGRDMFSQVLLGLRTSLAIAMVVTLVTTAIGVIAGITGGYVRGLADVLIARVVDFFLCFPVLLFAIAFIPILQQTIQPNPDANPEWLRVYLLIGVLVVFGWPYFSRLVRGQTILLRDREFIEAAKAMGEAMAEKVRGAGVKA